jgi:hypothetical protein
VEGASRRRAGGEHATRPRLFRFLSPVSFSARVVRCLAAPSRQLRIVVLHHNQFPYPLRAGHSQRPTSLEAQKTIRLKLPTGGLAPPAETASARFSLRKGNDVTLPVIFRPSHSTPPRHPSSRDQPPHPNTFPRRPPGRAPVATSPRRPATCPPPPPTSCLAPLLHFRLVGRRLPQPNRGVVRQAASSHRRYATTPGTSPPGSPPRPTPVRYEPALPGPSLQLAPR